MPTAVYLVNKCPAFIKPILSLRYFFLEPNGRIQCRIHLSRHWYPTSRPVDGYITSWPLFLLWRCGPTRAMTSSFLRFLDHTKRRITVCRTPLDEWSVRRKDLYMTTLTTNIHVPGGIRTHDLSRRAAADRAATGIGFLVVRHGNYAAVVDGPHAEHAGQNTITRT